MENPWRTGVHRGGIISKCVSWLNFSCIAVIRTRGRSCLSPLFLVSISWLTWRNTGYPLMRCRLIHLPFSFYSCHLSLPPPPLLPLLNRRPSNMTDSFSSEHRRIQLFIFEFFRWFSPKIFSKKLNETLGRINMILKKIINYFAKQHHNQCSKEHWLKIIITGRKLSQIRSSSYLYSCKFDSIVLQRKKKKKKEKYHGGTQKL